MEKKLEAARWTETEMKEAMAWMKGVMAKHLPKTSREWMVIVMDEMVRRGEGMK
jgi:hypothetical protein